jgi:hypothetical protein
MARRVPFRDDREWQARVRQVRAAGRRGESPADIAMGSGMPAASVQKLLAPSLHPRLSDPADLLRTGEVRAGQLPIDVQLHWFGFFTAAGYIRGQGSSLTLIVTLGEEGRGHLKNLEADLMMGPMRCEFCHSSLVGWQGYFRDPIFCNALIPWGIPSDLYGEDAALLQDLPEGLFLPFIRGYMEGDELARGTRMRGHTPGVTIRGTPAILDGLNTLIQRYWGIVNGLITQDGVDTVLHFSGHVARDAFESRLGALQEGAEIDGRA